MTVIKGIHVLCSDSWPGSPSRLLTESSNASGDISFRYGFYWFKKKNNHCYAQSIHYRIQHVDEISIVLPHGFDVFLLRFCRFFPARVCWFALLPVCLSSPNNPRSEFTKHERSKSYVCCCSKFEKNVNVTSGGFKIEEGCGNSVIDLPTCSSKSCSSPWWCSVCSSWSCGPAVNQPFLPDDAWIN